MPRISSGAEGEGTPPGRFSRALLVPTLLCRAPFPSQGDPTGGCRERGPARVTAGSGDTVTALHDSETPDPEALRSLVGVLEGGGSMVLDTLREGRSRRVRLSLEQEGGR